MERVNIRKKLLIAFTIIIFINYTIVLSRDNSQYLRNANINIERRVNPIGRTIGLKLYTDGVLVIGMSEITDENDAQQEPYANSGIKEGDMIKSINGTEVHNTQELMNYINESNGNEISIKYQRDNKEIYTTIKPVKSADNSYMLGLWVRDAAAGIGTLTYYEEATNTFAALGHGINDVDTLKLLNISNGELVTSQIVSIVKGEKGKPGEIRGIIDNGINIGTVEINSNIGVYGKVTNINYINKVKKDEVPVASRNQIKEGKIYKTNYKDNKSMLIKVTDSKLIEKTGGIIPGMSGTPIIQNGKFVGAITNVLLNDPTQGYAICADMMMK